MRKALVLPALLLLFGMAAGAVVADYPPEARKITGPDDTLLYFNGPDYAARHMVSEQDGQTREIMYYYDKKTGESYRYYLIFSANQAELRAYDYGAGEVVTYTFSRTGSQTQKTRVTTKFEEATPRESITYTYNRTGKTSDKRVERNGTLSQTISCTHVNEYWAESCTVTNASGDATEYQITYDTFEGKKYPAQVKFLREGEYVAMTQPYNDMALNQLSHPLYELEGPWETVGKTAYSGTIGRVLQSTVFGADPSYTGQIRDNAYRIVERDDDGLPVKIERRAVYAQNEAFPWDQRIEIDYTKQYDPRLMRFVEMTFSDRSGDQTGTLTVDKTQDHREVITMDLHEYDRVTEQSYPMHIVVESDATQRFLRVQKTLDGETVAHTVHFDEQGRPLRLVDHEGNVEAYVYANSEDEEPTEIRLYHEDTPTDVEVLPVQKGGDGKISFIGGDIEFEQCQITGLPLGMTYTCAVTDADGDRIEYPAPSWPEIQMMQARLAFQNRGVYAAPAANPVVEAPAKIARFLISEIYPIRTEPRECNVPFIESYLQDTGVILPEDNVEAVWYEPDVLFEGHYACVARVQYISDSGIFTSGWIGDLKVIEGRDNVYMYGDGGGSGVGLSRPLLALFDRGDLAQVGINPDTYYRKNPYAVDIRDECNKKNLTVLGRKMCMEAEAEYALFDDASRYNRLNDDVAYFAAAEESVWEFAQDVIPIWGDFRQWEQTFENPTSWNVFFAGITLLPVIGFAADAARFADFARIVDDIPTSVLDDVLDEARATPCFSQKQGLPEGTVFFDPPCGITASDVIRRQQLDNAGNIRANRLKNEQPGKNPQYKSELASDAAKVDARADQKYNKERGSFQHKGDGFARSEARAKAAKQRTSEATWRSDSHRFSMGDDVLDNKVANGTRRQGYKNTLYPDAGVGRRADGTVRIGNDAARGVQGTFLNGNDLGRAFEDLHYEVVRGTGQDEGRIFLRSKDNALKNAGQFEIRVSAVNIPANLPSTGMYRAYDNIDIWAGNMGQINNDLYITNVEIKYQPPSNPLAQHMTTKEIMTQQLAIEDILNTGMTNKHNYSLDQQGIPRASGNTGQTIPRDMNPAEGRWWPAGTLPSQWSTTPDASRRQVVDILTSRLRDP